LVLDVRTRSEYHGERIPGSIHVFPDDVLQWAATQTPDREVVAYCACPHEGTSLRTARQLQKVGFPALALVGGIDAWKAQYPLEPMAELVA
jgi:rhodanese-related sulfurtransferase